MVLPTLTEVALNQSKEKQKKYRRQRGFYERVYCTCVLLLSSHSHAPPYLCSFPYNAAYFAVILPYELPNNTVQFIGNVHAHILLTS